jgi:methylmalonyl-CoA mutase cobalamin-binding subunit
MPQITRANVVVAGMERSVDVVVVSSRKGHGADRYGQTSSRRRGIARQRASGSVQVWLVVVGWHNHVIQTDVPWTERLSGV